MDYVSLVKILHTQKGKKPQRIAKEPLSGYAPYIDIRAFEKHDFLNYTDGANCVPCEEGELLLVWDGARSGLVGRALTGYVGSTLAKITADGVSNDFLFYFLQSKYSFLNTKTKGTGIPHVNPAILGELKIPTIPLPEQERIVAKIEELFSNLDASVAELRTAQARLKVYRQAVLKKAFEATMDNMEPLSTIASLRLGKMLDQQKNQGVDRLYLRNVNVRWFSFDLADLKTMKIQNDETEKYSVQKGDLVICEGGEPGRCAVWCKDDVMFLQKALHRVRFTNSEANPFFYAYFVMYLAMSGELKKHFTGSGISHLTGHSLANMHVPAPSMQHNQIVQKIESCLSVCDHIERTVTESLKQSQALRQSILKKAFEGRLV